MGAPKEILAKANPRHTVDAYKTKEGWVVIRKALVADDIARSKVFQGEPTIWAVMLANCRATLEYAEFPVDVSTDEAFAESVRGLETEDFLNWHEKVLELNPLWDTRRDF